MKKLFVLLFGLAVGSFANAAAAYIGWTITADGSMAGYAYQFFIIGQNGVTSTTDVTSAIVDKDWDSVSRYALYTGTLAASGSNAGASVSCGSDISKTLTTLDVGTYEGFFIIYDSADYTSASSYIIVSSEQNSNMSVTVVDNSTAARFTAGNQKTYLTTSSNWVNVPEPTSGLLLLLGITGLALKRKRI